MHNIHNIHNMHNINNMQGKGGDPARGVEGVGGGAGKQTHRLFVEAPDANAVVLGAADHPLALPIRHRKRRKEAVLGVHVTCVPPPPTLGPLSPLLPPPPGNPTWGAGVFAAASPPSICMSKSNRNADAQAKANALQMHTQTQTQCKRTSEGSRNAKASTPLTQQKKRGKFTAAEARKITTAEARRITTAEARRITTRQVGRKAARGRGGGGAHPRKTSRLCPSRSPTALSCCPGCPPARTSRLART
jgi:hypothetical protein